MNINKELITRVVDECYSSKYKIFTINSEDGVTMGKPKGLFVSLGITTSLNTLKMVAKCISDRLGVDAHVSEIESRLISGKYSNKVTKESDVKQYDSGMLNEGSNISVDETQVLISDIKDKMLENKDNEEVFMDYSSRLSKIRKILEKFEKSGLDSSNYSVNVINTEDNFQITLINNKINYVQTKEKLKGNDIIVHKRIGILVKFD